MTADRDLLATAEAAAVRGWPAIETEAIHGWLARFASGGSVRANTVAALQFDGSSLDAAIDAVEAFYRARGALPRFTISDASLPDGLDAVIAARGYTRSDDHVTMMKAVGTPPTTLLGVRGDDHPTPDWYAVYLQGLSENRRAMAPEIVERVPAPRRFFSCVKDGAVIGSGLSVLDGTVASVQCMATLTAARRSGAATSILAAIERHAAANGIRWLYLQTESANHAAVALYTRAGFSIAGHYHTRDLDR